jgi:cadmium resistance protein CadD (predicted permease)
MSPGLLGRAIAIFAVTNVDDLLILALFFSRTTNRAGVTRVVIGQYLGFAAILVFSIIGALGAGLLADSVIPYLGLLPLLLGIRAAWNTWRQQRFGAGLRRLRAPALIRPAPGLPDGHFPAIYPLGLKWDLWP